MKTYKVLVQAALLALLAALVPACGGGNDDGGAAAIAILTGAEAEPNDTLVQATPLGSSLAGAGSLAVAGDVDFWSFDAAAGDVIEIEVLAARRDMAGWTAPGNRIVLALIAPDTTTQLVTNLPFNFSPLDQDISLFRVATTGTHYLKLSQNTPANAAGLYAFTVKKVTIPNLQFEAEVVGGTTNDLIANAELVVPGTVLGNKEANVFDFYKFVVAAPSIFQLQMTAYRNGSPGAAVIRLDPIVDLIDTDGSSVLKSNDDNIFWDSGLAYQINTPGTYFIKVEHFSAAASFAGPYFMTFSLSPVGTVAESEANNSAVAADPLTDGSIVNGTIIAGDDDFFAFTGTAGDMIHLQLLTLPSDVQGSTGGAIVSAFLDVDGATTLPSAAESFNLRTRRTILTSSGTFYVKLTTAAGTAQPYVLRFNKVQSSEAEVEPNDTILTATPFPAGGKGTGVISTPGDLDIYRFSASANELVTFSVQANTAEAFEEDGWGSVLNPELKILDGGGATITTSSGSTRGTITGLFRVEVSFVAPADGQYFIQVADLGGLGGPTRFYTLNKR